MRRTLSIIILAFAALSFVAMTASAQNPSTQNPSTQNPSAQNPSTQNPSTQTPSAQTSSAQEPMVGGAPMSATKDIVDNASKSADHTTLVTAVKAAGLTDTLKGTGPYTVFAPTNAAFDKLPAGTVDTMLKPENKEMLIKVLTYHIVPGKMDSKTIAAAIKKGNGTATFKTASGGTLTAMMNGNTLVLKDEKGGTSTVTIADVNQKNGVIHVVDTVLMP
jgi:uncharacterized surface protein with fasciclin (FAS1) repeats